MKVFTRSPFDYDVRKLEAGEVFELMGKRNDEKLLEHRVLIEVLNKDGVQRCSCGKEFMGDMFYFKHLNSSNHPKEPIILEEPVEFVSAPRKRKAKKTRKVKSKVA